MGMIFGGSATAAASNRVLKINADEFQLRDKNGKQAISLLCSRLVFLSHFHQQLSRQNVTGTSCDPIRC